MHRPSRLYTIDVTVHHGGLFALFPYRLAGIDGRIHLVGSVYKVFFVFFFLVEFCGTMTAANRVVSHFGMHSCAMLLLFDNFPPVALKQRR